MANRLGQAVLATLAASLIVWALLPLAPGDPAYRVLTARGVTDPTPLEIGEMRREMGLDRSLAAQYVAWVGRVAAGDLGRSFRTGRPVGEEIAGRLLATFLLVGTGLALAILASLAGGLLAAANAGTAIDLVVRGLTQMLASVPAYLIGLLVLQYLFVGAKLGRVLTEGDPSLVWWPALALAAGRAARWTQLLRANLLDALGSGFALVARARGASPLRVLLRHALPVASLPLVTSIGMSVGGIVGGAAIVEALFTWPGIGQYVLQAISARDFPAIQAFILISASSYVLASLAVDLLALWLDPRLRDPRA